jgi:hypothetical protein
MWIHSVSYTHLRVVQSGRHVGDPPQLAGLGKAGCLALQPYKRRLRTFYWRNHMRGDDDPILGAHPDGRQLRVFMLLWC